MRILTACIVFVHFSCTTTKNVQKSKTDEKTEIKTIETTTTTITIDTTVVVKGDSLTQISAIDSVLKGGEITTEDGNIEIKEKYDPVLRKIRITAIKKPEAIPVHAVQRSVASRTIDAKKEVKSSDFSKVIQRSWWSWWYLLIVAGLLVWIFRKAIFSRMI